MRTTCIYDKTANLSALVLIVAAVCAVLPLVYISRYVHPVNDDFSFALQHIGVPMVQSVIDSYMYWSGRYLATALSALNPYAWSTEPLPLLRTYSVILSSLILLIPICASIILTGRYIGKLQGAAIGALFTLTYLGLCESTGELLFWFSSYTAYTSGILLSLIFFAILSEKSTVMTVIQCLLALMITGTNEVTAVMLVMTMIYLASTYRSRRLAYVLLCAATGLAIVILSPGNGVRMAYRLTAHPYLWTIAISLGQSLSWLILWIPALLIATPLYALLGGTRIARLQIFDTGLTRYILFASLTIIAAHIPPAYGLGSVVIGRTANCLLMFFILLYFWGVNIIMHRREHLLMASKGKITAGCIMWCYLFIVPFNINSPVTTALTDIVSGKARQYDTIQTERLESARTNNQGGAVCRLTPFGVTSRTLYINDIESDPAGEFATNYCRIHRLNCQVYVPGNSVYFESNFDSLKNLGKNKR